MFSTIMFIGHLYAFITYDWILDKFLFVNENDVRVFSQLSVPSNGKFASLKNFKNGNVYSQHRLRRDVTRCSIGTLQLSVLRVPVLGT